MKKKRTIINPSTFDLFETSEEAWCSMYDAMFAAESSIYWEMYILVDDEAGKPFFDLLEHKAQQGVDVKLIIDGVGSFSVSRGRIDSLKRSGVDVRMFHERKHRYRGLWSKMISRTHRKILIVDETVGFIGGVNVQSHMRDWLDIQVKITGRSVHSLLRTFAKMYMIAGGKKAAVKQLLKYKFRVKNDLAEFIYDEPGRYKNGSRMRKVYTQALLKARERVVLFSPYYFPDKRFLKALWAAKKRGVRVDLLIPFRTDMRLATYLAYGFFAITHKAGGNIHLIPKMMHGKGVMVDDDYAVVGSSNLEKGSFYDNYEANVKFRDKKTLGHLSRILARWQQSGTTYDPKTWKKYGRIQSLKQWIALKLYRIWHSNH